MMRKLILSLLTLMIIATPSLAANHYLKPAAKGGSDDSLGTSAATAWATLSKVATLTPAAGDSIIIYGGIYNDQFYWRPDTSNTLGDSLKGTSMAAPIVFKAHGDTIAVFKVTGVSGKRAVFEFDQGDDFVKISGIGQHHYVPTGDSLCIKIEYTGVTTYAPTAAIIFEGDVSIPTSRAKGNVIEGVEITGYNTAMGRSYPVAVDKGIELWKADSTNVTSCKIQYCGRPESDPTHTNYEGYGIDMNGRFNIVSKCTVKYCGETCVAIRDWCLTPAIGSCTLALGFSSSNQVKNCILEGQYGGGVYIEDNSRNNLVQDNLITYCGEAGNIYHTSAGILMNGPRNSIRRNVIWNRNGYGMVVESKQDPLGYFDQLSDSNFVCNNVLFKNGLGSNLDIRVVNLNEEGYSTISSCKGNRFFNNIFYKAQGQRMGETPVEVYFDLMNTNNAGNWITPDVSTSVPSSTHWNNNSFHYNNFYSDFTYPFGYTRDRRLGVLYTAYSLAQMAGDTIWSGNYSVDPGFVSTNPDTAGAPSNWYTIQSTSSLIESGWIRSDPIGAIVHAKNAQRGWHDLGYTGTYADVGIEFINPNPAICGLNSTEFILTASIGDTVRDTLVVSNTAVALSDTIQLAVTVPTLMVDHLWITGGTGTVIPGASANVIFRFIPVYSTNVGVVDKIVSNDCAGSNLICDRIDLGIVGHDYTVCCDVYPASTIDFGMRGTGQYWYDTLYVGNCTDSVMTISPNLSVGTAYSIIAGDSLSEIASGDYNTLIIRFKPMTYISYPDTLTLSNVTCGTIVITGQGATSGYTRPGED